MSDKDSLEAGEEASQTQPSHLATAPAVAAAMEPSSGEGFEPVELDEQSEVAAPADPVAVPPSHMLVPEVLDSSRFASERTADPYSAWPPQLSSLPGQVEPGDKETAEPPEPHPVTLPSPVSTESERPLLPERAPLLVRMDAAIAAHQAELLHEPVNDASAQTQPGNEHASDIATALAIAAVIARAEPTIVAPPASPPPPPEPPVPQPRETTAPLLQPPPTAAPVPEDIRPGVREQTPPPAEPQSRAPDLPPVQHWGIRAATFAAKAAAAYAALVIALLAVFRFVDPPGSALMALRWIGGTSIEQTWVPIATVSPQLVRAVVVSEDWTFCSHNGIDLDAMRTAIEKAKGGIPRGASTISMQVAKNMFLWPSKSYVRKAIEVPLTLAMELAWPKRRILEVYLNVAEWGPGIFGAEAASQHHFQKSAASLTAREAAQLAASLPNPFRRDAGDPGPQTARKASVIQARMRIAGPAANCVLPPVKRP